MFPNSFQTLVLSLLLQQEVENFKKLTVISKDEFDTLAPKLPIDPNQEGPPPPMPGEFVGFIQAEHPVNQACFI